MSDQTPSDSRFQRANFVVSNLEKSLSFYQEVLGLSVAFVKDSDLSSYSYQVFEIDPSQKIRFAVLSSANQPRVMALTELPGADLPSIPAPRRSAIVIEVSDVDLVVQRAQRIGCHVYPEAELHTHDGRVGREVGIVDFDDNLTVIYHIPLATSVT